MNETIIALIGLSISIIALIFSFITMMSIRKHYFKIKKAYEADLKEYNSKKATELRPLNI